MTERVLEAMKLVAMWDDREEFCRSMKDGCKDCPFDAGRVCDKATTEWVLHRSAKIFRKYFDEMKEKVGD